VQYVRSNATGFDSFLLQIRTTGNNEKIKIRTLNLTARARFIKQTTNKNKKKENNLTNNFASRGYLVYKTNLWGG
jgi:hypothetical protein